LLIFCFLRFISFHFISFHLFPQLGKLLSPSPSSRPWLTALVFVSVCGVYELQGPSLGWWTWPDEDGVVKRDFNAGWTGIEWDTLTGHPHVIEGEGREGEGREGEGREGEGTEGEGRE